MNTKKKIVQNLNEYGDDQKKHVVMTSDKYKDMEDELDSDTVVKIMDEDDTVSPEPVNVPKLKADVQKFMDKLDLGQFKPIIAKIDKPIEKAELIAAFAERMGVPREKLPLILSMIKKLGAEEEVQPENTRPRMKKSDLVEHVLKNNK